MRPHEKLDVWKKGIDFVVDIYKVTDGFPKDERFGLTSQLRRAAVSIPANIAEGAARNTPKEFVHFLSIAQGSASEVETELLISMRLGFLTNEQYNSIKAHLDDIGRMLIGLSSHLRNKIELSN
jgi:four helix bundle protein